MKIMVTGWPKSGTSWLCRLLGDVLDSPVGAKDPSSTPKAVATEGQGRGGNHYIGQCHAVPILPGEPEPKARMHRIMVDDLVDGKIVLIMRDPRDICVSGSYHWGRPLVEFIELAGEGRWPVPHGGGLVPFYRKWFKANVMDCVTSYEWLHEDAEWELGRILEMLDLEPAKDIGEVVHRQSFDVRKKWTMNHGDALNYGKDWQAAFLRKGIVGDWKNHFGKKEIDLSEHYFGEFMDEVGYQR